MNPIEITKVIDKVRYSTKGAECIASNAYWDGHNFERSGRNTFLYKTPKDRYFAVHQTCWQGERDSLEPLTLDEAIEMWENLPEQDVEFEEAFPGVEVKEA